ncbi:MAG: hormogonium polysaccharide secretion pseudopilin HpsC [Calothrix sp. MO_167.B12]|nr:hormogonium polysaccharide secretion pseudopilin HpsC [Calothrix sp. MO_167.B12]
MNPIKFLLSKQIKSPKVIREGGFTLTELLVATVMSVIIITPMLGFMVNILNTDKQEQAKASSEQEIQAAMDYIARDLQQAVYIYDAVGIDAIKNELPSPTDTDRVPVLVFWKREFLEDALTVKNTTTNQDEQDDTFVYSLVAYYLIKDNNTTWSNAARIARWQIRDGVLATGFTLDADDNQVANGVDCPGYENKYVSGYCPSSGYASFNLEGVGTIQQKMNSWTRLSSYTDANDQTQTVNLSASVVLVDYIDQTTNNPIPEKTCSTGSKVTPADFSGRNTTQMTSFYACVDTTNTTIQVFLRGNALARVQNSNIDCNNNNCQKNYFPTASVRVEGRGFLFTE